MLPQTKTKGVLLLILFISLIFLGYSVYLYQLRQPVKTEPYIPNHAQVYNSVKNLVKKNLRAPITAVFPEISEVDISFTEGRTDKWEVEGYVDSQNYFGAMLRTKYKMILRYENATQTFYNEKLKFK